MPSLAEFLNKQDKYARKHEDSEMEHTILHSCYTSIYGYSPVLANTGNFFSTYK